MIISMVHEHSLDNNDFETKEIREMEVNYLKDIGNKLLYYYEHPKWWGIINSYTLDTKELLHYEP